MVNVNITDICAAEENQIENVRSFLWCQKLVPQSATILLLFNDSPYKYFCPEVHVIMYSRTPLTRTLKGIENLFELAGFRVIGVD